MGWWKDVSKKILKFELYCFLLELSCFLPINDIYMGHDQRKIRGEGL
jgi:hypothetical protein